MVEPIPVTVVGGYLGAGKTSLVNHLLRNAGGRRIAVLVNEFGALPIDADLIEGDAGDGFISIAGGCICCSYGSDLMDALMRLPRLESPPEHVARHWAPAGQVSLQSPFQQVWAKEPGSVAGGGTRGSASSVAVGVATTRGGSGSGGGGSGSADVQAKPSSSGAR